MLAVIFVAQENSSTYRYSRGIDQPVESLPSKKHLLLGTDNGIACVMGNPTAIPSGTPSFGDIFSASPIGIVVETWDGQPIFANPAFCSFLGFNEDELCDKHCVQFSPPEDAEKDWFLFQQLRSGQIDHYQLEKRYFRKDGSLVWGRLSLSLLKNHPSPLVLAMVEDITDKKAAENALCASEQRMRLAQRAARLGAFDWDVQTGVNTWTPELEALYGLAPGSFAGTHAAFEDLIHPDDRARLRELVTWTLRTEDPMAGEWRAVWPDGSIHWIAGYWQAFQNSKGDSLRVVGVNLDATERKAAEQALRESEERFRLMANSAPVMIWMSGVDKKPIYFNQTWLEFTGRSLEAELHAGLREITHPDDFEPCRKVYYDAFDSRRSFTKQCRVRRHDGEYRWLFDTGVPRILADGIFAGYIGCCIDITDHKRAEDALSSVSRQLIAAQEQERARIGRELHDDISQRLALLAAGLERRVNRSEAEDYLKELREAISQISADVQALSHDLHASKLEYLGVVTGMRSWCEDVAERRQIGINFKSDVSSDLPSELGLVLFRVLQESLNNSIKHSGAKRVEVSLREQSGEIHLIVRDFGKGFDIESAVHGEGLGLTSMRERIRLVNGTISIDSNSLVGTSISVCIPLDRQAGNKQIAV